MRIGKIHIPKVESRKARTNDLEYVIEYWIQMAKTAPDKKRKQKAMHHIKRYAQQYLELTGECYRRQQYLR